MTITFNGLPAFFDYMNTHFGDGWALVGGCAAWVHIAQANRDLSQEVGIYRDIFPKDIEVVCRGRSEDELEVSVGSRGVLKVDFVANNHEATTVEQCRNAIVVGNARTIPLQDIISRYKVATSMKQDVRKTRVYMLECILRGEQISPDSARRIFNNPANKGVVNPFAGVKLKPVVR